MLKRLAFAVLATLLASSAPAQTTTEWPTGTGFPNVPRTAGERLAGPFATTDGRMAILAWHNGVLFSVPEQPSSQPGSNFQARIWNITDPTNPRRIVNAPANGEGSLGITPQPINAHGYYHLGQNNMTGAEGHFLVLGSDFPFDAPWAFRAQPSVVGVTRELSGNLGAGVRGDLFQPWFAGDTYWSYNAVGGDAQIWFGGGGFNGQSQLLSSFDHLGMTGVIGHPFILGNLLIFASDQSRTGVATYDISDPTQPVLLDVLKTGGPGGYWPELWGNDGELYIVFPYNNDGNGMRVVDATDPSALRFVADVPLPAPNGSSGAMYVQFQDEFAFIGDHKVDMRTRASVLQFATLSNGIDISQFALPLGNLVVTGGVGGPGQGVAIYAHQAAPDTRAPSVAYHVPRAGQTNYPVRMPISVLIHETLDTLSIVDGTSLQLRRVTGPGTFSAPLPGRWIFAFDDVLTFTPDAQLLAGATYEFRLDGIRDVAGNAMAPYAFTFSTGGAVGANRPPDVTGLSATPYPAAPGATVTFAATATDADGDTLQFRYDFGDGSPKTAFGASANATHPYASPGHYRAAVQVRDPSGVVASRTVTVTVLAPLAGAAPTHSAPIVCDAPRRRVWVVNPDSDTVSALDADTLAKVAEHATCADPRSVARSASGQLWIACHDADRIRVLDETTGALVGDVATGYGSAPHGIAMSPDGGTAYVALMGEGELRRYATATRTQTGALALGPNPRALAVSADGSRVLVTRFLSAPNHGEVWNVDAATMQLASTVRLPKFGDFPNRDTPATGRGVANQLVGVALSPRTARAYVAANKPNSERGLQIHATQDLDEDNTVRNLVVELDPFNATPSARFRRGVDLDNSDSASAVAFSPLADYLFVALQGMDEVLVLDALALDASAGLGSLVTRLAVGAAPQGLCVDAPTERLFVQDFMGRTVTVVEASGLLRAGALQLPTSAVDSVSTELLASDVLLGKTIFYNSSDPRMSAEGYVSCATCHLDGGEDGRTWDFTGRGEGLRNTITLKGRGGTAHGNVHWSANFDEIQDFENDIRSFFGGSGFLSDAEYAVSQDPLGNGKAGRSVELDALAAYVTSLGQATTPRSPHRNADGSFSADATAGEALFEREQCTSCHVPPAYTNSAVGDGNLESVGTVRATSGNRIGGALNGLDVPTLRGAWASAPYFHDGSAATLDDVFRVTRGTRIPGETGAAAGGAYVVDTFVDLNNDDTVRGRAFGQLEFTGQTLTFTGVNGGAGGTGAIEVRYTNSRQGAQTQPLTVRVNGTPLPGVQLPASDNDPAFRSVNWATVRLENVPLSAGATNTIQLETAFWYVAVDEILVATPADLTAAQAHRRVQALPANERTQLVAFVRELDGAETPAGSTQLFRDGFE